MLSPPLSVKLAANIVKILQIGKYTNYRLENNENTFLTGEQYRTSRFNHLLSVIFHETKHLQGQKKVESPEKSENSTWVAPSDIISNLFLKDLDRIWELKKWIPDPCNPYLHYLNPDDKEVI